MDLPADRSGNLLGHEPADVAPVDTAHQFARQPPEGDRVIAVGRVGAKERCVRREPPRHGLPVEHLVECHGTVDGVEARAMAQQLPHRHVLLAVRGELRPELMHRFSIREQSAFHAHCDGKCDHTLRRAERHLQGVGRIGACRAVVEPATDEIDHKLAAVVHGDTRTDVGTRGQVVDEGITHRLPSVGHTPGHRWRVVRHCARVRVRRSANATTRPAAARSDRSD